jgi:hypothetical protein
VRRLLVALLLLASSAARADDAAAKDKVLGGDHWRLATEHGAIHVWTPPGYDGREAGIVIYVHGYYTDADHAWKDHDLARQFAASKRDALFIVPEAPASGSEEPSWPALGDLLREVWRGTGLHRPPGTVVVVGHSGAYRTIVLWLDYTPLDHIVLLDALYGNEEDFHAWLDSVRGHDENRLTIVTLDTRRWVKRFTLRRDDVETAARVPGRYQDLSRIQRRARVLNIASQYGHMEMVTEGKTIPIVLERADLPGL